MNLLPTLSLFLLISFSLNKEFDKLQVQYTKSSNFTQDSSKDITGCLINIKLYDSENTSHFKEVDTIYLELPRGTDEEFGYARFSSAGNFFQPIQLTLAGAKKVSLNIQFGFGLNQSQNSKYKILSLSSSLWQECIYRGATKSISKRPNKFKLSNWAVSKAQMTFVKKRMFDGYEYLDSGEIFVQGFLVARDLIRV